jgi:hypothetical protein
MTGIVKSPLIGSMNSRYSKRLGRALSVYYSERALYKHFLKFNFDLITYFDN